jgi:hypothetical protein
VVKAVEVMSGFLCSGRESNRSREPGTARRERRRRARISELSRFYLAIKLDAACRALP